MGNYHDNQFPGESDTYRQSRDELLQAEMDLRKQIEAVSALRRRLPAGGTVKEDYIFEESTNDLSDCDTVKQTRFSELFAPDKNSLIIYSFMFAPEAETPCPACTSILDSFNGISPHVSDRVNFAVVAKAPLNKIREWAKDRGWNNLRLLSSGNNTYNTDYFAENDEWGQMPAINVLDKTEDGIYHFYNTELLYAPSEEGQHPRHADPFWPLWNLFDITPEGRGTDWFPKYSY
jgi:predicted dithiol-disulfide oxidoreductase (DUF899 family)